MGMDCVSQALTPAAGSPEMMARLSMRGLRCGSRLITTREPLAKVLAKAVPMRATNSGVRSTFTCPVTP
jgi:hypothetical protein